MLDLAPLAGYHFLSSGLVAYLVWRWTAGMPRYTSDYFPSGDTDLTPYSRLYLSLSSAVASHLLFDVIEHSGYVPLL